MKRFRTILAVLLSLVMAWPAGAAPWLEQSTATTVKLGPFVSSTDGSTASTGLTIQKADVRLSKNGGNMAAAAADQGESDAGAPHDELGYYDIALGTGDTDTLGSLKVMITETGALPVWQTFQVVPSSTYALVDTADSLADAAEAGAGAALTDTLNISDGVVEANVVEVEGAGATDYFESGTVRSRSITDGYKDIYHVGAGYDYASIEAAETAGASEDDVILVHPGVYEESGRGVEGCTIYLTRGAVWDGSGEDGPLIAGPFTRFAVLGEGTIISPVNDPVLTNTGTFADIRIECGEFISTESESHAFVFSGVDSRLTLNLGFLYRDSIDPDTPAFIHANGIGTVYVKIRERMFLTGKGLVKTSGASAGSRPIVLTEAKIAVVDSENIIDSESSHGVFIAYGDWVCRNGSSNGLNVPANVVAIPVAGSIVVPSGRPSLSGSGAIYANNSFMYNTASATATNIIPTLGTAHFAADTFKAPLFAANWFTNTGLSTGAAQEIRDTVWGSSTERTVTGGSNITLADAQFSLLPKVIRATVTTVSGPDEFITDNNVAVSAGSLVRITDVSGDPIVVSTRRISSADGDSYLVDAAPDFTVEVGDTLEIWPTPTQFTDIPGNVWAYSSGERALTSAGNSAIWDVSRGERSAGTFGYYIDMLLSNIEVPELAKEDIITGVIEGLGDAAETLTAIGDELETRASVFAEATRIEMDAYSTALADAAAAVQSRGTIQVDDQTNFVLSDGPAEDGALVGGTLIVYDADTDLPYFASITAYVGDTKTATIATALPITAANDDAYRVMLPTGGEVDLSGLDSALADLNEKLGDPTGVDFAADWQAIVATLGTPAGASLAADILTKASQASVDAAATDAATAATQATAAATDAATAASQATTAATQATTAASQATTAATQSTTAAAQATTAATQSTNAATDAAGANTKAADIQSRLPDALVDGNLKAQMRDATQAALAKFVTTDTGEEMPAEGSVASFGGTGVATINKQDVADAMLLAPDGEAAEGSAMEKLLAVHAKTDNLPPDPADQSALEAALTAAAGGVPAAVRVELAPELARIDVATSTRATPDDVEINPTVEIVGGGPYQNELPGEAFTATLGRRHDGTSTISNPNACRIRAGETQRFGVRCSALLPNGVGLKAISEPTASGDDDIGVSTETHFVNNDIACVDITADPSASVGDTATVEYWVTPQIGTATKISIPVRVIQ